MATIGQQLLSPDNGYKRYDNTDSRIIKYSATGIVNEKNSAYYNGEQYYSCTQGDYFYFRFYGKNFRLIELLSNNRTNDYHEEVFGDGISIGKINTYSATAIAQTLVFEYSFLSIGVHEIKVTNIATDGKYIALDAVDIDDIGSLLNPILTHVVNSNTADIEIGNCLPCKYSVPTSGTIGTFSLFGQNNDLIIPPESSATPNGIFFFIFVGYDYQGRMKFIADRNIQHNISWDTLNNAGFVFGNEINLSDNPSICASIRLLLGGISSLDYDNEWTKIIQQSDLNGKITAGDKNAWHWNGICSWCSSTFSSLGSAYRTVRGADTVDGSTGVVTSSASTTIGFRPVLLIDGISSRGLKNLLYDKFLIQDGNNIKTTIDGASFSYSDVLPYDVNKFNNGMSDLKQINSTIASKIDNSKYNIGVLRW